MSTHTRHHRRRTTQIPASTETETHHRLPRLFSSSGYTPRATGSSNNGEPEEHSDNESPLSSDSSSSHPQRHSTGSSFLASAAKTYSRAMYAHTTSQISLRAGNSNSNNSTIRKLLKGLTTPTNRISPLPRLWRSNSRLRKPARSIFLARSRL
jgi:hypothetical protein